MGYYGNLEAKNKAIELRKKGLSYKEIQQIISIPKSTLSNWCRDIALTEKQALRLFHNKLTGSARGRIIGAKRQQVKKIKQIQELKKQGKNQVGKLSKRERFLTGIAFYASEGTKGDNNIGFANSDPKIILFMMNWFREFCSVFENKFHGALWIHDNLDIKNAEKFWSKLTKIPLNQFYKTYVVGNKIDSHKIRKNKHANGVFSIVISDKKLLRLINGWIFGILG